MRSSEPERVGNILARLKRISPLGKQLDKAKVWQHWPEVVGGDLHPHGRPYRIKGGTLYIEVESPVWMHKFAYLERDIVHRTNRLVGYTLISDIFLTLTPDPGAATSQDGV